MFEKYLTIINKYIPPESDLYPIYIIHVGFVTKKALEIGKKLNLTKEQLSFIEEASMLHDIGICMVKDKELPTNGILPYIAHGVEGSKILIKEGLEKHARVAETHTGVGIFREDVLEFDLPLEARDYLPETIEEKIISYADLFYSKSEKEFWNEQSFDDIRKYIAQYGQKKLGILEEWIKQFGN
jgi:uncharacterized protein